MRRLVFVVLAACGGSSSKPASAPAPTSPVSVASAAQPSAPAALDRTAPTTSIGQAPANNGDAAIIRRFMKQNMQQILLCYEKALLDGATLAGAVTLTFTIGVDGKATDVNVRGLPGVDDCVASVMAGIEFPQSTEKRSLAVTYPLTFDTSN
jgi:hypothetical protein